MKRGIPTEALARPPGTPEWVTAEDLDEYLAWKQKRREAFIESTVAYRESYDREGKFCPRRF